MYCQWSLIFISDKHYHVNGMFNKHCLSVGSLMLNQAFSLCFVVIFFYRRDNDSHERVAGHVSNSAHVFFCSGPSLCTRRCPTTVPSCRKEEQGKYLADKLIVLQVWLLTVLCLLCLHYCWYLRFIQTCYQTVAITIKLYKTHWQQE